MGARRIEKSGHSHYMEPVPSDPLPYANLTLEEALRSFRRDHALTDAYDGMSPEAQLHFERHDIIHVLFGLDTSMKQEVLADGWALFGTDISRRDVLDTMKLTETSALMAEIGWARALVAYLTALPAFLQVAFLSRKLHKKWHWAFAARYRSCKVADIRREFGIGHALSVSA